MTRATSPGRVEWADAAKAISIIGVCVLHAIIAVPGNGGTAGLPKVTNVDAVSPDDFPALVALAREHGVNLVVPGPEAPLVSWFPVGAGLSPESEFTAASGDSAGSEFSAGLPPPSVLILRR